MHRLRHRSWTSRRVHCMGWVTGPTCRWRRHGRRWTPGWQRLLLSWGWRPCWNVRLSCRKLHSMSPKHRQCLTSTWSTHTGCGLVEVFLTLRLWPLGVWCSNSSCAEVPRRRRIATAPSSLVMRLTYGNFISTSTSFQCLGCRSQALKLLFQLIHWHLPLLPRRGSRPGPQNYAMARACTSCRRWACFRLWSHFRRCLPFLRRNWPM
mmetsp:Transcript_18243/g.42497  ORF Transcript_18243/g.42497 Transcript_18243/m.42497 type:complete len:207 (-) Transcript_18243:500-1120(-)